jgi:hypothetical protein
MWIRSQDKTQLIKCNHIIVEISYIIAIFDEINSTTIGIYSTKEKALKVLDKIENFMMMDYYDDVFRMPQDDEVE